jgi:thiamine pyrophosphate-dependent acetolactate synthase large subunit-like protein
MTSKAGGSKTGKGNFPGGEIERPIPSTGNALFGSDVVADALRALDIPYIALTPGASFRGFHDSLVNYIGNDNPQMLLCLHEEHAVAITQGWAKVTNTPIAAAIHSNVGLMHATMAFFNAWCDRTPGIVFGATGPVDAMKRRPWIDWIHTAQDQGALIRSYTKWDNEPASPGAAREAVLRGYWLSATAPMGPVYINLDAGMQEMRVEEPLPPIDIRRFIPKTAQGPSIELLDEAAKMLAGAKKPLIMAGRVTRDEKGWADRVALAEKYNAAVITDLKIGAAFPTDHPLHVGAPNGRPDKHSLDAINNADVILSLDWVDLGGTFKLAMGDKQPDAKVIQVSLDHIIHNGWSMDHHVHPSVDLFVAAEPEPVVAGLVERAPKGRTVKNWAGGPTPVPELKAPAKGEPLRPQHFALGLKKALSGREVSLLHVSLSWTGDTWQFRHPLDYLGSDGGGGVGGGPGIAVGSALALQHVGSKRLPVAVVGDGDYLMGVTALWTAVHYRIPMMFVIANNISYNNDVEHQERVAYMRDRPAENKWIGQFMNDPEVDLVKMAEAQGATAFGQCTDLESMQKAIKDAVAVVDKGGVAVVDVRIEQISRVDADQIKRQSDR